MIETLIFSNKKKQINTFHILINTSPKTYNYIYRSVQSKTTKSTQNIYVGTNKHNTQRYINPSYITSFSLART